MGKVMLSWTSAATGGCVMKEGKKILTERGDKALTIQGQSKGDGEPSLT